MAGTSSESRFSFPPGSAPGPSGLRPCHLKDCLTRDGPQGPLECSLAKLMGLANLGSLPQEFGEIICGSNLIPLNKKDGGIRPIAVGDTLRRVMGKAFLRSPKVLSDLEQLQPRQCGVGVRAAAEMVGMGVQRLVDSLDPGGQWAVMQIDVRNAFNCIDRGAILKGCAEICPGLYNWLSFCYGQKSPLFCQGSFLCWSQTGVHQGDACGPAAFSLGLEVGLRECRKLALASDIPLWECWYLDDSSHCRIPLPIGPLF